MTSVQDGETEKSEGEYTIRLRFFLLAEDCCLVVILQSQVRDQVFAAQMSQGVLQLHQLNEQVVFGIKFGGAHRRFEIE